MKKANISHFMAELALDHIKDFHHWTVSHYQDFWKKIIDKLAIKFKIKPSQLCDLSHGIESPNWLAGAKMNIADSCFGAPSTQTAIIYQDTQKQLCKMTYAELDQLSNRIANSLISHGFSASDAIAIAMPMTPYAIAIYLGIIKMGGVVVSIADSFSSEEMAARLNIAKTKAVLTQDMVPWAGKTIPLYQKICAANAPKTIVLSYQDTNAIPLRPNDCAWQNFLVDNDQFISVACDPMQACNILFSSGTTGTPKAIPWNHTTPIKSASDAYFHQNIQAGDILAWPTNLGWMMGPWLVFSALINKATIAVYNDAPKDKSFGEFIRDAKVTMLGVVPTLVATWKQSRCMEGLDWQHIKVFSSTGECSNADDMSYLMSLGGNKPVIEYCGGTEIGGAYVSSTVIEPNYPALFSTPTMGLDFMILDENGESSDLGEVAIIPPSIGLSTTLINADHHEVYYANMPTTPEGKLLRRHGDQMQRLPNGYYCILGRVDDTMNIGGIKISAAEIERSLIGLNGITETAAVALTPPDKGPSQLVIYAATQDSLDKKTVLQEMQKRINEHLNPLFKIHDVVFLKELPKTASNKIMRRKLRKT
jgi:acetyl-CoA synthetase